MLHYRSFIIFHWPVIEKKIIAGRKCYSCNTQVSMFIGVWRLHAAIPCGCVWNRIPICNLWELEGFKTTCKLVFNRLCKPSVSSLYFLYKPNQKNLSTLKYAFLIQIGLIILSFFFCRLNCLFQVEVFEATQHILTSQAGWKIPKCIELLKKVN